MCAKTGTGLGKPCVLPEGHEGKCKGYLGALPLDVKYRSLRKAVPYSQKTLDRLTKPLLSLSPEFKPQVRGSWDKPTNKKPIYPAISRGTPTLPCLPFESGRNVLPGMESFA